MVPIVILQSYSQRMYLIKLGLFSLSASRLIYRYASFILTYALLFLSDYYVSSCQCFVLVFMQFLPLCAYYKEEKTHQLSHLDHSHV